MIGVEVVRMGAGDDAMRQAWLTDRDLEMLRWIGRCRFATADQVEERFGIHSTRCYRRLRPMMEAGLLKRVTLLHRQPGALYVSRRGMRTAGLGDEMPVPTVTLKNFVHDCAVVWEQIRLERGGCEVLTEREMRQLARTTGDAYSLRVAATSHTLAKAHMPDLAFRIGGELRALEVELARKSMDRLTAILAAYAADPRYAGVWYVVPDARFGQRVRAAGDGVGIGERLRVVAAHTTAA
jgi:hypothetical protein